MSETSYNQCHTSYRGYMDEEIDTAREMLRKYRKPCSDAIKELRLETNMPLSECGVMLRCLWRDIELERVQAENAKLRELAVQMYKYIKWSDMMSDSMFSAAHSYKRDLRELRIEVD